MGPTTPDEGALQAAATAGAAAYPTVSLPFDRFGARVAAMTVSARGLDARGHEIYLAAACLEGLPGAIAVFEEIFLGRVRLHVRRFNLGVTELDDLRQGLRIKLLTGAYPGLATFAGDAPLDAWVRVVAVRMALDLSQAHRAPAADDDEALASLQALGADPDLLLDKEGMRPVFQSALEDVLSGLDAHDKTILRLHFVDGLGIDAIGGLYHVHRATAARWLVVLREQVFDRVRERLSLGRKPSPSEFRSLVRLVRGDLAVSIDRVLKDDKKG